MLRERNKNCDFCRASWIETRKIECPKLKFKKIKALTTGHQTFGIYIDSVFTYKVTNVCCAWAAKEKALLEHGPSKFKL